MTPTWIPYNGMKLGGLCEVCRTPAAWALVKLHTGIALDLVRIVCDAHRPAVQEAGAVPGHGAAGQPDLGGADRAGEQRSTRASGRVRAPRPPR